MSPHLFALLSMAILFLEVAGTVHFKVMRDMDEDQTYLGGDREEEAWILDENENAGNRFLREKFRKEVEEGDDGGEGGGLGGKGSEREDDEGDGEGSYEYTSYEETNEDGDDDEDDSEDGDDDDEVLDDDYEDGEYGEDEEEGGGDVAEIIRKLVDDLKKKKEMDDLAREED